MEHNATCLKLVDLVRDFIYDNNLPYNVVENAHIDLSGIQAQNNIGFWLAWIYDAEIKSFQNEELICIKAGDPDFWSMFEFWLAFNAAYHEDLAC